MVRAATVEEFKIIKTIKNKNEKLQIGREAAKWQKNKEIIL